MKLLVVSPPTPPPTSGPDSPRVTDCTVYATRLSKRDAFASEKTLEAELFYDLITLNTDYWVELEGPIARWIEIELLVIVCTLQYDLITLNTDYWVELDRPMAHWNETKLIAMYSILQHDLIFIDTYYSSYYSLKLDKPIAHWNETNF
ncbi:hypothetical protein J6590_067259 [Homalodisca vitripennis]|nr:hypothetical protein J6590_067259 [Homalodisca vitripennis]